MAIDFHGGIISGDMQPTIHLPLHLKDMDPLSDGYCTVNASWFDMDTHPYLDINEICYGEGQISDDAYPDDWLRVIRLPDPLSYLIDGSHLEDFQDDQGKFIAPLPAYLGLPYEGAEPVVANDFIRNRMQLEGVEGILRSQFGFELGKSVLRTLAEIEDNKPEES